MSDLGSGQWAASMYEDGEPVMLWAGAGNVANAAGDLYGTSPQRLIRAGKVVIDRDRLEVVIAFGWRVLEKAWPDAASGNELVGAEQCDPDFAWIERTEEERSHRDVAAPAG